MKESTLVLLVVMAALLKLVLVVAVALVRRKIRFAHARTTNH
jgi:hypothetical protein